MPDISPDEVKRHLEIGDKAKTMSEKGRALEDLVCYLFEQIPGVDHGKRNALNVFGSEEIDVAFWNKMDGSGFYFLPHIILVECKNWSRPVGSEEVDWFNSKLKRRGQTFGILVAASGVTGDSQRISAAHETIRIALSEGRRLVVVTRAEIERLRTTNELVSLIQEKLCELVVSGTLFL